jgi:hypothetical protein
MLKITTLSSQIQHLNFCTNLKIFPQSKHIFYINILKVIT